MCSGLVGQVSHLIKYTVNSRQGQIDQILALDGAPITRSDRERVIGTSDCLPYLAFYALAS